MDWSTVPATVLESKNVDKSMTFMNSERTQLLLAMRAGLAKGLLPFSVRFH